MMSIFEQPKQFVKSNESRYWLLFFGIIALYSLLIIPTLARLGIGWDEEIDLRIARSYLTPRGFFFGVPLDLSQTRLPMFSVALIFRILGVSSLIVARWTSVLAGVLTLLGIYVYGKERFSYKIGLLAAGLLALNPFFMAFSRLAFTESDVYLACTLTWFLVAMGRLQARPTVGNAAVAGLVLGLTVSAKATVLVVLPALWAGLYVDRYFARKSQTDSKVLLASHLADRVVLFWAGVATFTLLVGIASGMMFNFGAYPWVYQLLRYGLICFGWGAVLVWGYRFRHRSADPFMLAALLTGLGLLTFVIFPPEHLTNSGILRSIFGRAETEMSFNFAFMAEAGALHLLSLVLKSTLVLGFSLLGGMVFSLVQWRRRELTLPLLMLISYLAGLLLLPLVQTFYTIPVLPLLSLLLADQFMRLWVHRRKLAAILAVLTIGWWGIEMVQCYPDYHLNGYQWVGERVLFGRSSVGYRSVVYTPSDGVEQVIEWLNTHAKAGQTAQLYISPWHIVRYAAPDPGYHLTDGFEESISSNPDYIVMQINALLSQGHGLATPERDIFRYPFDYESLKRDYEQVFTVKRAFDLEIASVWQRNR